MPESREAVRGGEYAARGDYHRTPDPAWDYYPTYVAKLTSVRRWLSQVGPAAPDLAALWMLRKGKEPAWSPVVEAIRQRGDPLTRADLAVSGNDLQALGASGPEVGRVLSALLDQVLEEPSRNQRDQLLDQARTLLQ